MTIYVFTGPTLSPEVARRELNAVYLPPVAQGDVYRVCRRRPQAIGIIDGYFERVPAVWHKEILWAMQEGVHVFGSASMGALRAAELAPFGMEGVGWIFEAYRDGVLTDDDEVAVAHGPAETGYRAMSEAMVNIRRTLARAHASGVIGAETRAVLERNAKALFYADRSYPRILRRAADEGASPAELEAFRAWLPDGRVDQKREDALAMLRLMRERVAAGLVPKQVRYTFAHTDTWETARQQSADRLPVEDTGADGDHGHAVLDELRLDPDAFERVRVQTLVRLLAEGYARRQGFVVDHDARQRATDAFRRQRGLLRSDQVARWLEERQLSGEEFSQLMDDEAQLRWTEAQLASAVLGRMPDQIRLEDGYPALLARAQAKQRWLEAQGLHHAGFADLGLAESDVLRWYFGERLGRPLPPSVTRYAEAAGFADRDAFCRAVLQEYCYATRAGATEKEAVS